MMGLIIQRLVGLPKSWTKKAELDTNVLIAIVFTVIAIVIISAIIFVGIIKKYI